MDSPFDTANSRIRDVEGSKIIGAAYFCVEKLQKNVLQFFIKMYFAKKSLDKKLCGNYGKCLTNFYAKATEICGKIYIADGYPQ